MYIYTILIVCCISCVSSIVIRIQSADGLIKKYNAEPSETLAMLSSRLIGSNPTDILCLSNGDKYKISSLCQSFKTLSDCNIKHGDLLTVIPSFQPDQVRVHSTRKVTGKPAQRSSSPLKSGSSSRIIKERAVLVRIRRQTPTSRLAVFHNCTRSMFDRACLSNSVLLLLGKSSMVDTADKSRSNVYSLQRSSAKRKVDDIVAVIELTNDVSSDRLTPMLKRRLDSSIELANSLNLTVLGCSFGNVNYTLGWTNRHIHLTLQVASAVQKNNITAAVQNILVASARNATVDVRPVVRGQYVKKDWKIQEKSRLMVEAFQFSEQTVKLVQDRILTVEPLNSVAVGGNSANAGLVQLNGSVLMEAKEVTSVEATVLLVPVAVRAANVTSSLSNRGSVSKQFAGPVFYHLFPSFDLLNGAVATHRQAAEEYLLRLLKNILKGHSSSEGVDAAVLSEEAQEAVDRLRDPHLLMFLQATLGDKFCRALCQQLMNGVVNRKKLLGVDVIRPLEQLMRSLEYRLRPNKDGSDEL